MYYIYRKLALYIIHLHHGLRQRPRDPINGQSS
jgi:hypothetical protein